jgi:ABC-2 type transport system ATP-binding protein
MTDAPAIEFSSVIKDYESGWRGFKLRALDNLTLNVPRGQILGLLGPNGSGKSTAIKLALGLMTPTAGRVCVFGIPAGKREARSAIGYLPEAPDFYRYLSGRELLRFHGQLCGLNRGALESCIAELLELVGMDFAANRRVGSYSKGMLQRIGLAQALIHDPALLILDEPTAGVDPEGAAEMGELILKLKTTGKTILITSHLLDQMEEICDRVAILDRGQLLREGAVAELVGAPTPEPDALFVGRALRPTEPRFDAEGMSGVKPDLRSHLAVTRSLDEVFLSTIRTHRARTRSGARDPASLRN